MLRCGRVEQVLDSVLAERNAVEFEQLKTPFACIAAEMLTAEEVVLDWGIVPQAIRASMAIPGIFKPVEIDGRKLVDGGMMNNLPVDVARQMAADIYINPPLPDQNATSFGNESMRQMITIGEQAMKEKWNELMKLIPLLQKKH